MEHWLWDIVPDTHLTITWGILLPNAKRRMASERSFVYLRFKSLSCLWLPTSFVGLNSICASVGFFEVLSILPVTRLFVLIQLHFGLHCTSFGDKLIYSFETWSVGLHFPCTTLHSHVYVFRPGSAFIKLDQLDPWIKDQIGNTLLSTILHLKLPFFVLCGRDRPSHMTQNLVTVGVKL